MSVEHLRKIARTSLNLILLTTNWYNLGLIVVFDITVCKKDRRKGVYREYSAHLAKDA
jgi:hypothetical protein